MRKLFDKLNIRKGFNSWWDLLGSWEDLVEECEEGYNQNQHELDYDLIIRSELQTLIENDSFKQEKNYIDFCKKVYYFDNRFLNVIRFLDKKHTSNFWKRRFILKKPDGAEL